VVVSSDGSQERRLALQVKHELNFAFSDATFQRVINDCWAAFTGKFGWPFNPEVDRIGLGLGIYQTDLDRHFRPLLEWARASRDGEEFSQKVNLAKFSSAEKRTYLLLIINSLTAVKGSPVTDNEVWKFLSCLVVLHFDLALQSHLRKWGQDSSISCRSSIRCIS